MHRLLIGIVVLLALAVPASAGAATIVVDNAGPATPTTCTLPDAVEAANTDAAVAGCTAGGGPTDTIEFDLPSPATITLSSTLTVSSDLVIAGPGAGALTVSGNDSVRVLRLEPGVTATVADLTIAHGRAASGAGIFNDTADLGLYRVVLRDNEAVVAGGTDPKAQGGAVYSSGNLRLVRALVEGNTVKAAGGSATNTATGGGIANDWALGPPTAPHLYLEHSTVRDNDAIASGGTEALASGGGVTNNGTLLMLSSTVSGNDAVASGASGSNGATGGGVANTRPSSVGAHIGLSTIAENSVAAASPAGVVAGGGISSNPVVGWLTISHATIAYNSAPLGANLGLPGGAIIDNTIVAEPLGGGQNCQFSTLSQGSNISEDGSCNFTVPWDQNGVDALLAPGLADNGGPTETIALLHGSPAIDQGSSSELETTDQRGRQRPVDILSVPSRFNGADIGAFEVQVPHATITGGPLEGATVGQQPSFSFIADEAGAGFLCALDGGAGTPCTSPFVAPRLTAGEHTFTVAAVGAAGYAQEPPAKRVFRIRDETSPPPPPKPPVAKAPQTKLTQLPQRTTQRRLTIRFSANQAGSRFSCKLDGKKWRGCSSPYTTPRLALGRHTFRVKAIGPSGVTDATPAKQTFRVIAPRRR